MSDYTAIIPIVIVVLSGCAAMIAEAFRQRGERMPIAGFGLIGLAGAALASVFLWGSDAQSFGVVRSDNFALFINLVLCIVGVLTMLFSDEIVEREQLPPGEYYALTLFAISGMMLMAAATDLLVIFLALEVLSLSVYVLTGIRGVERRRRGSGVQVFPARRLLECVLPLRRGVRLRGVRLDQARRARRGRCRRRAPDSPRRWRCWRSGCSSSDLPSRFRPCRSTCGRRTPTRARRRS